MEARDIINITMDVLRRVGINDPSPQEINLVKSVLTHINISHQLHFNPILSFRERQCLLLLAQGKSFAQIAIQMDVKRTTIATFIKRIKAKLHCSTLPQLVFSGVAHRDIWA